MIIRSMKATFGVLDHRTLTLKEGLNVIEAPNESGKSTWCAFLRTMLYGPDTSRRRSGELSDKIRYTPWNGALPWGSIDLEAGGQRITLTRKTVNPAAPMRAFSAVYTGTGLPVSGLTESDAGEALTGVTLPVFRRTAFITGGEMGISASPELEKKISALLSAGEQDSASFTEAAARLRAWDRKCVYRGQGKLPELEREIAGLKERLQGIRALHQELDQAEITAEKARLLADSLKDDRPSGTESAALRLEQKRLELERRALDREREAREIRDSLRQGPLRGRRPDAASLDKARKDAARAGELQKRMKKPLPSGWVTAAFLILTLLTLSAGIVWHRPVLLAASGVCLCLGVLWRVRRYAAVQARRADARELNGLLKRYAVLKPEEIEESCRRSEERWRRSEALLSEAEKLRRELASLEKEESFPENSKLREAEERSLQAARNAARLRGRLDTMEEPWALSSELSWAERELETWKRRHKALEIAAETLTRADEEVQLRFAPELSRRAESILCRLTGGRYKTLVLGRDLSPAAGEDAAVRESGYLSRGTLDQTYLALRLALCELLLDGRDPCPLILDDALTSFDDRRMGSALDLLSEMAEHRQIILFTCQKREAEYLRSRNRIKE